MGNDTKKSRPNRFYMRMSDTELSDLNTLAEPKLKLDRSKTMRKLIEDGLSNNVIKSK